MFHTRGLVDANRKEIASLLTSEHGKVLSDALGEVACGLENIEFACGIPNLMKGGYSEQASTGVDVYSIRQPLGVVAGIALQLPRHGADVDVRQRHRLWQHLRPQAVREGPSASLLIADLLKQAGLPDGVFSVIQGDKVAVDRILEHPDIAAVSFVGSTPIARYIYETGTRNGKRVQALGGAKNHMVVLPDADIDMAADAAVSAGYGSAGERCMAISVVVAVGQVADPLVEAIKARLPKLRVGPGSEPDSEMGPLITREHRDKVASYVDTAAEQGANRRRRRSPARCPATASSSASRSSTTSARPWTATGTRSSDRSWAWSAWTPTRKPSAWSTTTSTATAPPSSLGTAAPHQFQFDVNVGMVGVNVPIPVPVAYYSFGGWKASLFGDTHMYGPDGVTSTPAARS